MIQRRIFVALFVVSLFAVGCFDRAATPTSPTSIAHDQLIGTWNLLSIQTAGEGEQPTPTGVAYSVTVTDGRLSTRVDCNICNGAISLSEQTVTVGPTLACTR